MIIEIVEVPAGVSFEEMRSELCFVVAELNRKRLLHHCEKFQPVQVIEKQAHLVSGKRMLIVSCSDEDKRTPFYVRRVQRHLANIGTQRCRVPGGDFFHFVPA